MFKQLRKTFIRMNMLVISLLMLASLTVIYLLIYTNAQSEIQDELGMLLSMSEGRDWQSQMQETPDKPHEPNEPREQKQMPGEVPRIGFVVYLNEDGYELSQSRMFFTAEEFDVEAMLELVQKSADVTGSFALDGYTWTYKSSPAKEGERIAFVETSETKAMFTALFKVFFLVTVPLLAAIWSVSWWFAKRSVAPIEEAYHNQRRFIQDASHELKTPVAAIKTNLELLASHEQETVASQSEWICNAQLESEHMARLIARLLTLARIDSDNASAMRKKEVFSLSERIESALLPLEALLYERKLNINSEIESGVCVSGDAEGIVQWHGGSISVESTPDSVTTFTVILPLES